MRGVAVTVDAYAGIGGAGRLCLARAGLDTEFVPVGTRRVGAARRRLADAGGVVAVGWDQAVKAGGAGGHGGPGTGSSECIAVQIGAVDMGEADPTHVAEVRDAIAAVG